MVFSFRPLYRMPQKPLFLSSLLSVMSSLMMPWKMPVPSALSVSVASEAPPYALSRISSQGARSCQKRKS